MQYLQQTADSQVASQTAILEANKAQSIAELEQAYANAVAEGNISIRDAQAQFDAQKKQIEADAYANSDRTALYGVDNGIQNSQQMQGLIRGDQARTATLNNTNASTRDSRINDIKDRLTQVAAQKDFGTATANATYNSGVAQAKANAGQLVAQNMFDVMNQDRQAKQQHAYDLDTIKVQSAETVKQMQLGHTLDMEKIKTQFQNDMQMENIQYGHQSALQSQANKAEMERLTKQAELDIQKEQKAYETSVSRELAKYKEGTPEYNIRVAQLKESRDQKIADIHANTMYEYKMKEITENPALETDNKSKPTDYEAATKDSGFGLVMNAGQILNWLNNYSGQVKEYNAYQEALKRKDDFLKNPEKYLGF
jgi:hypothetical protein